MWLFARLIFFCAALILSLFPSFTAVLPYLLPRAAIYRLSLALTLTQLLHATPLARALTLNADTLATLASMITTCAFIALLPNAVINGYAATLSMMGCVLAVLSSLTWVSGIHQLSRRVSALIGGWDNSGIGNDKGPKSVILGMCFIFYLLSLRWLCLILTSSLHWYHALVIAVCLVELAFVTILCVRARRAVLSEAAAVMMISTMALYQWIHTNMNQVQMAMPGEKNEAAAIATATVHEHDIWLLDHLLPTVMDCGALFFFIIHIRSDDGRGDEEKNEQEPSRLPSPRPFLLRALTLLLLTYYLSAHLPSHSLLGSVWNDALSLSPPASWSWLQHSLSLMGLSLPMPSSTTAESITATLTSLWQLQADAWIRMAAPLCRAASALGFYHYLLRVEQEEEETGRYHED